MPILILQFVSWNLPAGLSPITIHWHRCHSALVRPLVVWLVGIWDHSEALGDNTLASLEHLETSSSWTPVAAHTDPPGAVRASAWQFWVQCFRFDSEPVDEPSVVCPAQVVSPQHKERGSPWPRSGRAATAVLSPAVWYLYNAPAPRWPSSRSRSSSSLARGLLAGPSVKVGRGTHLDLGTGGLLCALIGTCPQEPVPRNLSASGLAAPRQDSR